MKTEAKLWPLEGEQGFEEILPSALVFDPTCLFVLKFYGPVNPMGSCRAQSVNLTTRLLGRLSPLGG